MQAVVRRVAVRFMKSPSDRRQIQQRLHSIVKWSGEGMFEEAGEDAVGVIAHLRRQILFMPALGAIWF